MKTCFATFAAGLIVAATAFASGSALAQDKIVLKASDVHPEGYPTVQAVEDMGKNLSEATKGKLSVQMYPSMQLGGEKEAIEQAQVGAIAFARVSVGALGPVVDALNVFNLPYVFRNTEHMRHVIDGKIGQDLLDAVTNSGKGLVGLCWMDAGARNFYDTKKPIKDLADLKGLKIRVMGNPMFVDMANSMGANGVPLGYDQVFSAAANRRGGRRRKQSAELRVRQPLPGGQVLHHRRAPDRAGDAGDVEEDLRLAVQGRAGGRVEVRPPSADG